MIECKYLPNGADEVEECLFHLSNDDMKLLLFNVCNDLYDLSILLDDRLSLDVSFEGFYFKHYRSIRKLVFECCRDLEVVTPEPYLKADRILQFKNKSK